MICIDIYIYLYFRSKAIKPGWGHSTGMQETLTDAQMSYFSRLVNYLPNISIPLAPAGALRNKLFRFKVLNVTLPHLELLWTRSKFHHLFSKCRIQCGGQMPWFGKVEDLAGGWKEGSPQLEQLFAATALNFVILSLWSPGQAQGATTEQNASE